MLAALEPEPDDHAAADLVYPRRLVGAMLIAEAATSIIAIRMGLEAQKR